MMSLICLRDLQIQRLDHSELNDTYDFNNICLDDSLGYNSSTVPNSKYVDACVIDGNLLNSTEFQCFLSSLNSRETSSL